MGTKHSSSPGTNQVIQIKLKPPRLHAGLIQRDNLLRRLDAGLSRKLTVVIAPTGFGKSTLVSQWITERGFSAAWVTLDKNDNDPSRFWTYVASALRAVDSSLGKATLSALTTPQTPSTETLLTPLINDLTRLKETCVLVLEDYHVIDSAQIHEGVEFLIQHLPESIHLVLITRSDPDLPLATLRARDELVEIDAASLRFNQQEAEVFLLEATQFEIPPAALTKLWEQTEGWAAGLRLVALSLQKANSTADIEKFAESFSGSDRYVADYLTKEVFAGQADAAQTFLLKSCFFNRLTGSLCDALTEQNNGASMLERLERDNLFLVQLERVGDRIWYRYNSLFAESIQYLARQRLDETSIKTLYEKASDWFEYHGLYDDAIENALAAKLFDRALALIETFIEIHDLTELYTLGRWLKDIPQDDILRRPTISFAYAQVILYSEDRFAAATAIKIEPFLQAAERSWRAEEEHQRLGQLLSFRGIVAWWQGAFQKSFEFALESLDELPEFDVLWRGNSLLILSYGSLNEGRILRAQDQILEARALLGAAQNIYGVLASMQMLAEVFYWQGEFEQTEQLNQQILVDAVGDESMLDDQGSAFIGLGHVAYEKDELERAEQFATRALELGLQRGNEMVEVQATVRLAYIHAARDDFERAHDLLKSLVTKIKSSVLLDIIQETQARLSILSGDLLAVKGWLAIASNPKQDALPLSRQRDTFTWARAQIAEGKVEDALHTLKDWVDDAAANGRVRSQVEALCLQALAYSATSNTQKATQVLIEALTISQTKGFRRLFLDEGPRMAMLLRTVLPSLQKRTLSLYANILLHSFQSDKGMRESGTRLPEPLTQQEVRVLRLLVAGMSNAEIARELVLSTNTVKTHVKSIYRKMSVNSREAAREVARGLKLL